MLCCQAAHENTGLAADGADPLGVHVEAFVKGEPDSRDETEEVPLVT